MSISIRLALVGKKHAPAYKIVVATTRDKRNGKFLDVVGHYNPSMNPVQYNLDEAKFNEWKAKGALITEAVQNLKDGTYEFKPYKKEKKDASAESKGGSSNDSKSDVNETETYEWLTEVLKFIATEDSNLALIENNLVIPNKHGVFCKRAFLHIDKIKDDELLKILELLMN